MLSKNNLKKNLAIFLSLPTDKCKILAPPLTNSRSFCPKKPLLLKSRYLSSKDILYSQCERLIDEH